MDTKKVYMWDINEGEGLGIFRISQVLSPAMEVDFVAFSKEEVEVKKKEIETHNFNLNEEKMRVIGPILIPNKEFWRTSLEGYVKFSEEAVEKARATFKKNNDMFSVNIEHQENEAPAFLLEDWIIEDSENDKANTKYNLNLENGTWVGVMQITDKNYWNDFIKSGKVRGFSVEIDKNSVIEKKLLKMDKKNIEKLGEATLQDGTIIYWDGETIEVGVSVFTDAELTLAAPDGEHIDGDGNRIVTRDGVVVEILPAESTEAPAEEDSATEETSKEYALKSEVMTIISELQSRIEILETELKNKSEKNEELEKEVENLKSNTPGSKSFVFKKKEKEVLNVEVKDSYSSKLKKSYQELGKL